MRLLGSEPHLLLSSLAPPSRNVHYHTVHVAKEGDEEAPRLGASASFAPCPSLLIDMYISISRTRTFQSRGLLNLIDAGCVSFVVAPPRGFALFVSYIPCNMPSRFLRQIAFRTLSSVWLSMCSLTNVHVAAHVAAHVASTFESSVDVKPVQLRHRVN